MMLKEFKKQISLDRDHRKYLGGSRKSKICVCPYESSCENLRFSCVQMKHLHTIRRIPRQRRQDQKSKIFEHEAESRYMDEKIRKMLKKRPPN